MDKQNKTSVWAVVLLSTASFLIVSCAHGHRPDVEALNGKMAAGAGQSSFAIIEGGYAASQGTPQGGSEPIEKKTIQVAASLIGRPVAPKYPDLARQANAGAAMIGVRITIGTDGSVIDVSDSPVILSLPNPLQHVFRATVEETVKAWRFRPAVIETYEPGQDLDHDGKADYSRLVSSVRLESTCDLRFDFSQDKASFSRTSE